MKQPTELYYICHIDNLESILEKGICSRKDAEKLDHEDIHDREVLARRNKQLPNSKNVSECVNLYFHARNAMLYRLTCNIDRKKLVVLQVSSSVLDQEDVCFSDRNVAAFNARFFSGTTELKNIDASVFKKEYWTDSDDTKQKMMAEVLVPDRILPDKIIGIYSSIKNDALADIVGDKQVPISVEPYMFFAPQYRKSLNNTIFLSKGDMFFSTMQTFTISVNTRGIMGKGLASRTKYQFPDAYVRYQDDCKNKKLKIGKPTLYKRATRIEEELADDAAQLKQDNLNGSRWFLFFPTKRHWREDSRLDDIEKSMQWLVQNYKKENIESIALPALGCGLGNLHWKDVGPVMCHYLKQMDIKSCIYLPMDQQLPEDLLSENYLLNSYDV